MIKPQFERTLGLLKEDTFNKIQNTKIVVAGLGGVGGTAFEALIRSGFINVMIIDFDKVSESNLNRQILYTFDDVGNYKTDCAKKRALSINNEANITSINENINELDFKIIEEFAPDIVIDAIDNVAGKIKLAKFSLANNIPIIMSLGMANRVDPSLVKLSTLDKTTHDPLAKKMRYEIRKENLNTKDIKVVYSDE